MCKEKKQVGVAGGARVEEGEQEPSQQLGHRDLCVAFPGLALSFVS